MAGNIAYTIEHKSHERSNFSVRQWEIPGGGARSVTPFAIRRQQSCQQLESCGIEAQTSLVCERQRSGNMQPDVPRTPSIVEPNIQEVGAET